jgi:fused signal recognition particle receptor
MIFAKLRASLKKTREKLASGLGRLFGMKRDLNDAFLLELEEVLYGSDLGTTALTVIEGLREDYRERKLKTTDDVRVRLREILTDCLGGAVQRLEKRDGGPLVVLVVGVNGSGKTTSIAKLAQHLKNRGHAVTLAACDTFRAAAVEQLSVWAERLDVPIVRQDTGADPAAVAFDSAEAALARNQDFLLVDTAGRQHTREDLMAELGKIRRVLDKKIPGAPHETLLVLDGTTGQNAIRQAEEFTQVVPLTGVILSKLDGTARGGAVVSIRDRLDLPVRYIGVGETADDLEEFDPQQFLDAILGVDADE